MLRKLIISCFFAFSCLLLFAGNVQADLVLANGQATGQWYNPDRDGEGFYVEIINTGGNLQISVAMYSYDDQGNQLWVIGNVPISETATSVAVPVFLVEGPVWGAGYDKDDRDIQDFGTITVRFPTCDSALFAIQTNPASTNLASGQYSLVRLTDIVGIECTDPPPPVDGRVAGGLWTGPGVCFFVNEDGSRIIESDLCDGKAFEAEIPGIQVDIDNNPDADECQANVVCDGAWEIFYDEGDGSVSVDCLNELGGVGEVSFQSATSGTAYAYEFTDLSGNFCSGIGVQVSPSQ